MTAPPDEPNWFETRHEPHPLLPDGFPVPALHTRPRDTYQHVGLGGWTGYWPPEDLAVPPDLEWTETHKVLVLATYQQKWGRFLEPNQTYEIDWPPVPSLINDGYVISGTLRCDRHNDEDCMECDRFHELPDGEVQPAEWSWSAMIETYEWSDRTGSPEAFEWFRVLTTWMDPRDVDYESFSTDRD